MVGNNRMTPFREFLNSQVSRCLGRCQCDESNRCRSCFHFLKLPELFSTRYLEFLLKYVTTVTSFGSFIFYRRSNLAFYEIFLRQKKKCMSGDSCVVNFVLSIIGIDEVSLVWMKLVCLAENRIELAWDVTANNVPRIISVSAITIG